MESELSARINQSRKKGQKEMHGRLKITPPFTSPFTVDVTVTRWSRPVVLTRWKSENSVHSNILLCIH